MLQKKLPQILLFFVLFAYFFQGSYGLSQLPIGIPGDYWGFWHQRADERLSDPAQGAYRNL